jgi:hypothetical protein
MFERLLEDHVLHRFLHHLHAQLEDHYATAHRRARALPHGARDAGFMLFGQELAAALLGCALFFLFPTSGRREAF